MDAIPLGLAESGSERGFVIRSRDRVVKTSMIAPFARTGLALSGKPARWGWDNTPLKYYRVESGAEASLKPRKSR